MDGVVLGVDPIFEIDRVVVAGGLAHPSIVSAMAPLFIDPGEAVLGCFEGPVAPVRQAGLLGFPRKARESDYATDKKTNVQLQPFFNDLVGDSDTVVGQGGVVGADSPLGFARSLHTEQRDQVGDGWADGGVGPIEEHR